MAHPPRVKAEAMSMLILGDTVGYVAKTLGIPKQTISRWKTQAFKILRKSLSKSPQGREFLEFARRLELSGVCNSRDSKRRGKIRIDIA